MESAKHGHSNDHSMKKIALIVDDSSTARQLLKKLLESYGHEVMCAESAEIAIQMLNQTNQTHPDVIFMDHNMPGMDGLQALKTIKTNPRTAMIPILMYTSQGDSVYAEQAKRFGAVGIIPKELKHVALKEVLDTLDKIITKSKQGESEYNENNFPAGGPVLTESVQPSKPLPTHVHASASKLDTSFDLPSTKSRGRASIEIDNPEAGFEKSADEGNKTHKSPNPQIQTNAAQNPTETHHQYLLVHSIKLIQQQIHDIQLQMNRTQQEFQHSLGKIKKVTLLITLALMMVNVVLWLNPSATLDASFMHQSFNTPPSVALNATTETSSATHFAANNEKTLGKEKTETSSAHKQQKPLQQQLQLLQNLINQGAPFKFGSPPFNDSHASKVETLLNLLPTMGFNGTIQLTAYFTDFCVSEQNGSLELANDNLPIEQCQFFSIDTMSYSELQSLDFSNLLGSTNPNPDINISVTVLEDLPNGASKPDRSSMKTAGSWNKLIANRNRVEYQLINAAK